MEEDKRRLRRPTACRRFLYVGNDNDTSASGLPDFPWYNLPKREKYTKWPQNIPNSHKIYQMAKNIPNSEKYGRYHNIVHYKTIEILPKFGSLVRKMPSGNPGRLANVGNDASA
jgi:hypothetical protein